jgi:hypothetical protein
MLAFEKLTLAAALVVAASSTAYAGDPRCSRPPYGGSADRYRALNEAYSQTVDDLGTKLEGICNMKFGGADRAELLKLGLTNDAIDKGDTSALAVKMFQAAKISSTSK